MIEVTFLNVDQGDSIILKWQTNEGSKYGLIDSNLVNNTINRTQTYLAQEQVKAIEFIILSHPHEDHFSGLEDVLKYCYYNRIQVKNFYHTASQTPEYLKAAVYTN